jgi:hypothetical protein
MRKTEENEEDFKNELKTSNEVFCDNEKLKKEIIIWQERLNMLKSENKKSMDMNDKEIDSIKIELNAKYEKVVK